MPGGATERKTAFIGRLVQLTDNYPICLVCKADNVGALQLQTVRKLLRGIDAHVLMGKNTLIRKGLKMHSANNPLLEALSSLVYGNVGLIFTKGNLKDIRKIIQDQRVGAPAKIGVVSPVEVVIPAGPTGLEPTQTGFLQALNIATKINKGQIEIVKDHVIIKIGQKVTSSEAQVLHKLNIRPFSYGLEIQNVYDNGSVYSVKVLDLSDEDILASFQSGVRNVAAVSMATGIPTLASVPHSLYNGYQNVLAVSIATDYTFEHAKKIKELLANPAAMAAAAAAAAPKATSAAAPAAKEDKKAAKEEKKE